MAKPPEVIILRGPDKLPVDDRDTTFTRMSRREMEQINETLSGIKVDGCYVPPLRRIFNGHFSRGGRMYAEGVAWQILSKDDRAKIRIADEPVVEVDYAGIHPALLYAEVGRYAPAEAYLIDGWPRKLAKVALNTLINAPNIRSARLAIAHSEPMREVAEPGSQRSLRATSKLIATIKRVHWPIAQFFHTGKGLRVAAPRLT